ncbi:hypothetical protein G9X64_03955 [Rhizobium sophorae]|uniref:Uncharacterized protein n=1 Tax=Rhizobium sophorae TaxID=1535242 RepID=A0A7Y3S270_9HYPH|nr:hypothetical protein [Rhizobium sophorae]NNU35664.1 hypothetical protein [Rhizobium sophorae]
MSGNSFQERVWQWIAACFPPQAHADVKERTHRFLEEALELAQANGCSRQDAQDLVDYVYGRAPGELAQETGGTLVTLAALCNANGIDMEEAGQRELDRNWARIDRIRAKQAARPQGSALPQ